MSDVKPVNAVVTLDQFAALMANWFFAKSEQIDQLIVFPEHEAIKVVDHTTGVEKILYGAEREAFIEGLKVARTVFDALPFKFMPINEDGTPVIDAEHQEAQTNG